MINDYANLVPSVKTENSGEDSRGRKQRPIPKRFESVGNLNSLMARLKKTKSEDAAPTASVKSRAKPSREPSDASILANNDERESEWVWRKQQTMNLKMRDSDRRLITDKNGLKLGG